MAILLSQPLNCLRKTFNEGFSDLHAALQTCDPVILVHVQELSMRIGYLVVGSGPGTDSGNLRGKALHQSEE